MRRSVRIAVRAVAVATLIVLLFEWDSAGWWPLAAALGQHNAQVDVAHGHYKILTHGIANPEGSPYANLLRQRYGVELHAVAGCIVSKSLVDYVDAYNNVSTDAVNRKFGHDVFKEVYDEDEANWRRWKQENPVKAPN
ncbi:MAG: hypothetical protein ABSC48_05400 [Terracidiphilus sp.]|jgi:hypothetical protein